MFFLSKMIDALIAPINLLFVLLCALSVLGFTRWRGGLRPLLVALVAVLALIAITPWPSLLMQPLEDRYPPPQALPRVDGIIVLGGAINPALSAQRGQPSLNGAAERMTTLIALGRTYPKARIIFSGGSGSVRYPERKEAVAARQLLAEQGFDVDRVMFEDQSRNTRENALFSQAQAKPAAGEVWLLVTSALHMPRAMGCFAAVGWPTVAYPVDYQTGGGDDWHWDFDLGGGLLVLAVAGHEWLGLLYYDLRGWISR